MYPSRCSTSAKLNFVLVLLFALSLTGCDIIIMGSEVGTGEAGPDGGGNGAMLDITIRGDVGASGLTNSSIILTTVGGKTAWSGTSSVEADYAATISVLSSDFPLTLLATGGSDFVSGFSPEYSMRSTVVSEIITTGNINPFSTFISDTAANQAGGINGSSITSATDVVFQKLNFGFDATRIADPITSPVQNSNAATLVRANEALAEMIRRTCRVLLLAGFSLSTDQAIAHLSGDLTDGVIDGRGIGSDARVAATSSIVSAQILLEVMTNDLQVGGFDAENRMDAAILMMHPDANVFTNDLTAPAEMISQAALTIAAAHDLLPTVANATLFDAVSALPPGATVQTARQYLLSDSSEIMGTSVAKVAAGTASDHEVVNLRLRLGLDLSGTDRSSPYISLIGSSIIPLYVGDTYVERGANATDNRDGDLTSQVIIDNESVNTSIANDYFVTYNLSDSSGNSASEVVRTVSVTEPAGADTVRPVITLVGDNPLNLVQGDTYVEPGATAMDNVDGDISSSISIDSSAVVTSTVGNYQVGYTVSDAAGNQANPATRSVVVSTQGNDSGQRRWERIIADEMVGYAAHYDVTGGKGGELVTVTNLNNSGAGSLRQAIADASGPTWIRFSQGLTGRINLSSTISFNGHSNFTIDGRGADITINGSRTNYTFRATNRNVNNFILMYLKFTGGSEDIINIDFASKFWFYHLSLDDAGDEMLSIRKTDGKFTLQETLFGNTRGMGILFYNSTSYTPTYDDKYIVGTMYRNHFKNRTRSPRINAPTKIHFYNNHVQGFNDVATVGAAHNRGALPAEMLYEDNIVDANGKQNQYLKMASPSLDVDGKGKIVGTLELSGAYGRETLPDEVFIPPYSYTSATATIALRDSIIATSGWQDVPFPD